MLPSLEGECANWHPSSSAYACDSKGPVPDDGSVSAYQNSTNALNQAARGARTPSGYTQDFVGQSASVQEIGYLTYKNIEDGSYNVQECADFCDSVSLCKGFNIFYERDPQVNPGKDCLNPDPITNIKCALYGYGVSSSTTTNQGQYRGQFLVVIVGSNGKCLAEFSAFKEI